MSYGKNWVLFSDKPPLSAVAGRTPPEMDYYVIVATKSSNGYIYSIEKASYVSNCYDKDCDKCLYAWKFF